MGNWHYDYDTDVTKLAAVLAPHRRDGFTFVNIGANDGVLNDPCWPFVERWGWSGVCVEPVPDAFERLCANYAHLPRVQLVQAALATAPAQFFYVEGSDFASAQIGSLDRARVEQSLSGLALLTELYPLVPKDIPPAVTVDPTRRPGVIASFEPQCLTFGELVARCALDRIDMVNIDAEGRDWEVLQMIDLDQHRVSVVVIETVGTDDHDAIERRLVSHGFTRRRAFDMFSTVWDRPARSWALPDIERLL